MLLIFRSSRRQKAITVLGSVSDPICKLFMQALTLFLFNRACYSDGSLTPTKAGLTPDPKPCAGNDGTTIAVRNVPYHLVRN